MTGPALDAAAALDNLVNQFSDPLSFYRELIQNALDAGSAEIDVRLEYDRGVAIANVDDYGEGMNRKIIDGRLTRLFSSAKDGDLTKIGRFGIGFVSVFATEPDAVVVDTSRDGENWRILFERDRTFTRIERPEPVEGTKIRIFKAMTRKAFEDFRERSRRTITFWTRHAEAEIRFDGEPINVPFDLEDAVVATRHAEAGTEVVVGYRTDFEPRFGFYNKGLTLLEGVAGPAEGVAFKIDSHHLEHTLTRDNIVRDKGYEKAMSIVDRMSGEPLRAALLGGVEAALAAGAMADLDPLHRALARHVGRLDRRPTAAEGERRLFRTVGGEAIALSEVLEAGDRGRLLFESVDGPLAAAVAADGWLVVDAHRGDAGHRALEALTGRTVERLRRVWCLPLLEATGSLDGWEGLAGSIVELVRAAGAELAGVRAARFRYPGSMIRGRVAITQARPGQPTRVDEARLLGRRFWGPKRTLVVNLDHDLVRAALSLAVAEPALAALTLVRVFHLPDGLDPTVEARLASRVLARRR